MAGIAYTRADAIRWALARIRERPAYEWLRGRGPGARAAQERFRNGCRLRFVKWFGPDCRREYWPRCRGRVVGQLAGAKSSGRSCRRASNWSLIT
jgi:hypothetical protein